MGLFRRTMSSSSSKSRTSTVDSASDTPTPRTSSESEYDNNISPSLTTIKQTPTAPPILSLPIELVQQITAYLDSASAASFCLSSRFICYAIGTNHLTKYIEASTSRFEKRRTIEAIVERAFPGHWFCAWCDKFHAWHAHEGPKQGANPPEGAKKRDCTEFNSYLPAGPDYTLSYHHIRLAINRSLRGPSHGIPLAAFSHTHASTTTLFNTPAPTTLDTRARIVHSHLLLHATWSLVLPAWSTPNKRLLRSIWPALPHLLAGHRDSEHGHTGLMAAIDNVVRRGWTYPFTQLCSTCATDWAVSCHSLPHQHPATAGHVRLVVQTWRDLGAGRNPFETAWRAHGVPVHAACVGSATHGVGLTQVQAGEIRRAFESAGGGGVEEGGLGSEKEGAGRSSSRSRIYRSFMGREGNEGYNKTEVRRSRARPHVWRTRSENVEARRRDEEERLDVARNVAEELVRLGGVLGGS